MSVSVDKNIHVGILGGGLSAITLGRHLRHSCEILEKEDRPGGLCRSFEKDGFRYDIGGHILFSKDAPVMKIIKKTLGKNTGYQRRNNKVLFKGRYVKYPFENGLSALDKEDIFECLSGYLNNTHKRPKNFEEWIYYTFGDGIAQKYLIPYNRKIWKHDLKKMSMEWVERVPKPPLEDILKSAIGIETEGYTHQLNFIYPRKGGIESLVAAMQGENARLTTGFAVRSIRKKGEQWLVSGSNGDRRFDKLVVTIPVQEALRCMENVPHRVKAAADALLYNAVRVVLVGVRNESLLDKSAAYVPQSDVPFHRVCFMGYFSKENVPKGSSSLIAEITAHKGQSLYSALDSTLTERVVAGLAKLGIVSKNDVITTDVHNSEYGYVVYDAQYAKSIAIVKAYFRALGIELLGRFAQAEYINMDEVIRRGTDLAHTMNASKGGS